MDMDRPYLLIGNKKGILCSIKSLWKTREGQMELPYRIERNRRRKRPQKRLLAPEVATKPEPKIIGDVAEKIEPCIRRLRMLAILIICS